MLFPELGPEFYQENDTGILKRMSSFYSEAITINQSFWEEADIDTRFEAGDQALWNDIYGLLTPNRRKQFNFNRIRRVVNMIGGHQRRNRKSTIVTPVENADAETADQFTKIMMWVNQQEGVLETISESFHGALVTGMNLLQVWSDFRNDPISGNIKVDNCSYNSFLIDPFFRKADLSDCNSLWKRSYVAKNVAMSLLPGREDEIKSMSGNDQRDGKFNHMPESYNAGTRGLLAYDEFYYRDTRSQRILVDVQTGESQEWRGKEENLKDFLGFYPQITIIDSEIPTVRLAVVLGGRVMYDGPNPLGTDRYPFVPVFGYYNPQIPDYNLRLQGVVRGLRDPQYLYNRRKVIELDIFESQINSGFKYKEDALVNPRDVFLSGQGRGLALKQDALMSDVEQIMPPQIPPSMIQLSEILAKEIQEISGVNEELLGSANDDKAGVLAMLRQGAGLTTLQILFDQLDRSQKLLGSLVLDVVQLNFTPGKVKRITEEEPSPQFYNKAFGKYDAAIEEGMNTTTQRQMQFAQLLHLKEAGIPVPDDVIINASTIQNKKELVESIESAKQQQQQQEQIQVQAALEEQKARVELAKARAVADEGLGVERLSRVEENRAFAVERMAEAKKDRTQSVLNIVKAIKELDDIELAQIEKMMRMSSTLKGAEEVVAGPTAGPGHFPKHDEISK